MDENIEIFTRLWEHAENEVVEFKKAETNFDVDELGKYFSALSNEANLREREFGWIVFGVWDKKHEIVGTSFKDGEVALNKLKQDMSQHTTDGLIFREIIPLEVEGKRVLLFKVPATPPLFPDTMKQYDDYTIREALHNCIAHQDYTLQQRISFVEGNDKLYYGNGGSFIPGTIENALEHKGPQRHYRNECLCTGMVNFNMIDTVGRGIKKIFAEQRNRFFPMPDYDIDNNKRSVGVTIYGKMLDEKYSSLLKTNTDLTLKECVWLDAIQKHRPVTKDAVKHLKEKGLIEGRSPNYIISLTVAKLTHQIGHNIKEKGLEEKLLEQTILQLARDAGNEGFKLADVYEALHKNLPASMNATSKKRYLGRLLSKMGSSDLLQIEGRTWRITEIGLTKLRL